MTAGEINLAEKLATFSEHYRPRTVGTFNGPVADEEVHRLLIEPTGTPNAGDPKTAAPRDVI